MSLNIYTQICGLVITIVILLFYILQRKMNMKREQHFLRCIIITIFVLALDIAATVLNTRIPTDTATVYVNRAYLIATILDILCVFLYLCGEAFSRKVYSIIFYITMGFGSIIFFLVACPFITDNVVTSEANGRIIYTTGWATNITYFVAFIGILGILSISILFEKNIGRKQAIVHRIWMLLWSCFAIIQFLFKEILICSFALGVGMMIMFISLEALEGTLDKETGLFNWNGYLAYINERKKEETIASIVFLKAMDTISLVDDKTLTNAQDKFNKCISKQKGFFSFGIQGEYIFILKDIFLEDFLDFYNLEKESHPIIAQHYFPFYLRDATALENQGDLFSLVELAKTNVNKTESDRITIDTQILEDHSKMVEIETCIEKAIKDNDIIVLLQPIYSTRKSIFTSAEALVRIKDKEGKILSPGLFIPIAEKNGMIHKLDEMVFDKVCQFISTHSMEDLGLDYIEINLSVAQLCDEKLADRYIQIIEKHKIPPKYINLEITESAELDQQKTLQANLHRLVEYGFSFSIDDYGTGYSNLNYVVSMPVEIIKFDKQLIDSYFEAEVLDKAHILMEHSISMFKSLNLRMVAEGVEEEKQLKQLIELEIDYIQGYYFSKPLCFSDFETFIIEKNNLEKKKEE